MKNTLLFISAFFLSAFVLVSCDEDSTGDVSRVTYFADFTMEGSDVMFLDCGQSYSEPGVTAEENGNPVDVTTSAVGTYFGGSDISGDNPDVYTITYTAVNSDGFPGSVTRRVYAACNGDMVNSIEGLYTSTVLRGGVLQDDYVDMTYVIIRSLGDDKYELTHAIGGYYDIGRKYGPGYAARGAVVTANDIASNDFSYTTGVFPIWGNVITLSDMMVDPSTKTITFHGSGDFGNGEFDITLTQVNF